MNLSFRARILWLFAGLLSLALILGLGAMVLSARPRMRAEAESGTRLAREFIETALVNLQKTPDPETALAQLRQDFLHVRHVRISIAEPGRAQAAPTEGADQSSDAFAPDWFQRLIGAKVSITRAPLAINGVLRGEIIIASNPADEAAEIWADVKGMTIGGVGLAFAAFIFMRFLASRSLAPVAAISGGLARMADGFYDHRIPLQGPSDFVDMARKLNALADKLGNLSTENRLLSQRIIYVQDEERREIARNLHDDIGPALFAIRAGVTALSRKAEKGAINPDVILQAAHMIGAQAETLQQINRSILGRLRPSSLNDMGLSAALTALADGFRQQAPHTRLSLKLCEGLDALDETIALTLYRIVQEGLTNALRHASADHIDVEIALDPARTILSAAIRDNGLGFDPAAKHGFGLIGMRERLLALGGRLTIETRESRGALIAVVMPARRLSPDKT